MLIKTTKLTVRELLKALKGNLELKRVGKCCGVVKHSHVYDINQRHDAQVVSHTLRCFVLRFNPACKKVLLAKRDPIRTIQTRSHNYHPIDLQTTKYYSSTQNFCRSKQIRGLGESESTLEI